MSRRKPIENPHRGWEVNGKPYDYSPLKLGEKSRRCERCGGEYVPNARAQKYCGKCRKGA